MCAVSFGSDLSCVSSIIPYTGLKLWLVVRLLRHVIQKELWGHGMGRHTPQEILIIGQDDMKALSSFIGAATITKLCS